jgi:23S rRNA (adenine2030-N6)-methyltransferase
VPTSRYREGASPDYGHRFHAGNVGDVWKHCALIEVLRRVAGSSSCVAYLDTHAGEGRYALGATGEWTEGIGRLWEYLPNQSDTAVARYVELCRRIGEGRERPVRYPGSPMIARDVLGADAAMTLWERDAPTCDALRIVVGGDARVSLVCDDGLVAIPDAAAAAEREADVVVLIDPPYTQKADWIAVPDALARAVAATKRACFVLWYPVKSLTRPNAMIARLADAGVPGTIAELVTTPLDQQRNRLNGSGVLLVRPPAGAIEAIAAAAPIVGATCATQSGRWSMRTQAWD